MEISSQTETNIGHYGVNIRNKLLHYFKIQESLSAYGDYWVNSQSLMRGSY